jgi:hypothetical protein
MKDDLTITRGGYKHISLRTAAELTGYSESTIWEWKQAGAITHIQVMTGKKRRRIFVAEEDVAQVAMMSVQELHDLGITLTADYVVARGREWTEVYQGETQPDATRNGEVWEATEDAILELDIPVIEMAKRLGRTYLATGRRRNALALGTVHHGHEVPS